jgi:thiamine-phosphate pyrophosphorylase
LIAANPPHTPNPKHFQIEIPPVYPITDKGLARKTTHFEILKELVRGGARLVQIRDKQTPLVELLPDLRRCVEFAARHDVTLILNDRCDLVLSTGAHGVHLGQADLEPQAARNLLGMGKIIGFSTHTLPQLRHGTELPVHYLGFGPIYPTSTKLHAARIVGVRTLRRACSLSSKPVVAIGGIGLHQVREVLDAGAASAAVISALMEADDLAREMELFLKEAREKV